MIEQAAFVKMTARIKTSVDRRGVTGVGGNMTSVSGVVVAGVLAPRRQYAHHVPYHNMTDGTMSFSAKLM